MTPHQRIRHWRKYAQRQAVIEEKYMPLMERAIGRQFQAFTAVVKSEGIESATTSIERIVDGSQVHEAIKKVYTYSALNEASVNYQLLKDQNLKFRGFGFNAQWTAIINAYLNNTDLLNTVQGITDTTKERILKVISEGISNGDSVDMIVKKLESDEYTSMRARLIVRTESVGATNMGSMIGAISTGIVYQKEWISALDHRVRGRREHDKFSHIALNGDVVDIDKPYNNGEAIRFPGDPNASAGNRVNCRCTQGFIAKRDSSGRIMRYTSEPMQGNAMSSVLLQTIAATVFGSLANSVIGELVSN